MTEQMTLRGTLKGHNGWVTQIATTPQFPDMILSASRGKGWGAGQRIGGYRSCTCLVAGPVARVSAARKTPDMVGHAEMCLGLTAVPTPKHRLARGSQSWIFYLLLLSLQVCLSVPRNLRVGRAMMTSTCHLSALAEIQRLFLSCRPALCSVGSGWTPRGPHNSSLLAGSSLLFLPSVLFSTSLLLTAFGGFWCFPVCIHTIKDRLRLGSCVALNGKT